MDEPHGPASEAPGSVRRPQEIGWDERVPFDYEEYTATKDHISALHENGALNSTWASAAAKYEWSDEYGDVGPAIPELENELFSVDNKLTLGDFMRNLTGYKVTVEGPEQVQPVAKFENAGLHPVTLDNVQKCGYLFPTPIQAYTIPAVLAGKDVIGIAQTGSGKTAAYLVPILSKLMGKAKKLAAPRPNPVGYSERTDAVRAEPLVIIIVPTRELALQIFDDARRMCYRTMLRPCVVYGGGPRRYQLDDLKKGCDILIGTPGRLMDLVTTEARWISLNRLKYTVIDEADEMVQDEWEAELDPILRGGASTENQADHVYLLFSATFPKGSRALARKYLADDHIRIRVGRAGSAHINVYQKVIWVDEEQKEQCLEDLLMSLPPCRTLVFCNSVRTVDAVDDFLYNKNFPVTSMHSNRTQREREDAIRSFRSGRCPIMVASGVSSRGLDIKSVMHVINYDLPSGQHGGINEYVHRIGRTGRIGNRGQASSFYNERNEDVAEALVKILMECDQLVPDFLESFKPTDGEVKWQDDTDDEDESSQQSADVAAVSGSTSWGADESGEAWGSDAIAKVSQTSAVIEDVW